MFTLTIEMKDAMRDRITASCTPVPLDPETQEPTMTEAQWARKTVVDDVKRAMKKREKRQNRYVPVPINDEDFNIE
jgi:hypothetical protein